MASNLTILNVCGRLKSRDRQHRQNDIHPFHKSWCATLQRPESQLGRDNYAGADSRKSLSDVEDLKEIFDFGTILGPTNVNQLLHYTAKRKLRKDWRALAGLDE